MSYSRPLPHSEYIRLKYSEKSESKEKNVKEKKRKAKSRVKTENIKIIDDDIDIKDIRACDEDDDDMSYAPREDKPSIAGVVDERPNHLIRKDLDTNRWRTLLSSEAGMEEHSSPVHSGRNNDVSTGAKRGSVSPDLSPPRANVRQRRDNDSGDDSDLSPPRASSRFGAGKSTRLVRSGSDSDSDLSPPRSKQRRDSDAASFRSSLKSSRLSPHPVPQHSGSHSGSNRCRYRRRSPDSHRGTDRSRDRRKSPESHRERSHRDVRGETSSGKAAGLSDSKSVREEMKRLKGKEAHLMKQLGEDALGRNAKTVYRDRGTGRIRDLEAEAAVKVKPDKEEEERTARYKDWSQGLKQREDRKERLQEDLKEMDKPLARYEDDEDREKLLKAKELEEDPMLQFVRRKKLKEKVREAGGRGELVFAKPAYKGPPPPPNRFSILPGYRWDGVDRSNGYEKKLTDKQAERMAGQEEAYKWSTEDM